MCVGAPLPKCGFSVCFISHVIALSPLCRPPSSCSVLLTNSLRISLWICHRVAVSILHPSHAYHPSLLSPSSIFLRLFPVHHRLQSPSSLLPRRLHVDVRSLFQAKSSLDVISPDLQMTLCASVMVICSVVRRSSACPGQ